MGGLPSSTGQLPSAADGSRIDAIPNGRIASAANTNGRAGRWGGPPSTYAVWSRCRISGPSAPVRLAVRLRSPPVRTLPICCLGCLGISQGPRHLCPLVSGALGPLRGCVSVPIPDMNPLKPSACSPLRRMVIAWPTLPCSSLNRAATSVNAWVVIENPVASRFWLHPDLSALLRLALQYSPMGCSGQQPVLICRFFFHRHFNGWSCMVACSNMLQYVPICFNEWRGGVMDGNG